MIGPPRAVILTALVACAARTPLAAPAARTTVLPTPQERPPPTPPAPAPDPDPDRDGILAAADRCPRAWELYNGNEDDDGCPDAGPHGIRLDPRGQRLEFAGKILFRLDSPELLPVSAPLLDELAAVLRRNPHLGALRIESHADARGARERLRELCQGRADAVLRALVERGVEPARLRAIGVGPARPIVCNDCGVEESRRIELWIEAPRGVGGDLTPGA